MDEIELIDPDVMGITVDGLTARQINRLKVYYQNMTGDMDLESLEKRTEHF